MAKKTIGITGSTGKTYDLDKLSKENTRGDSSSELLVQIWEWSPELPITNPHHYPNPCKYDETKKSIVSTLQLGQMWMSKLVKKNSAAYIKLLQGTKEE